jgi:gamma-tubulin complex component 4
MLHGQLLDSKGEFFIEKITSDFEKVEEEEGDTDEGMSLRSEACTDKGTTQFRINERLAPSYLPARVLEKILFIGEAVQIFQSLTDDVRPPLPCFSTCSGFHLRAERIKFSQMLTVLQNHSVFQIRDFESTVEYIRDVVAQHLWKLLVEEADLIGHVQIMKDMFLLGRGELFLSFIDMADTLLKQPPTATTQHDMNVAFRQAMIKIALDHEELTKQFQLILNLPAADTGKVKQEKKSNSWRYIGITHTVSWPLHVVFTPASLGKLVHNIRELLAVAHKILMHV